jgi:hypothetical protein
VPLNHSRALLGSFAAARSTWPSVPSPAFFGSFRHCGAQPLAVVGRAVALARHEQYSRCAAPIAAISSGVDPAEASRRIYRAAPRYAAIGAESRRSRGSRACSAPGVCSTRRVSPRIFLFPVFSAFDAGTRAG